MRLRGQAPTHILVPQGWEHQAVCRGLRCQIQSQSVVIPLPLGPQPVAQFLARTWPKGAILPTNILVMGLCGSLTSQLQIGHQVLYQDCLIGSVQGQGCPYSCDRPWTEFLQGHFPEAQWVHAITSDRLIRLASEKQALGQRYGADVVDMEGAAVLQYFQDHPQGPIPVAMLRVISDASCQNLPDLTPALGAEGSLQPLPLGIALARQPRNAAHLIRGAIIGLRQLTRTARHLPMAP